MTAMPNPSDITYRMLTGDELSILDPTMRRRGWSPLNFPTSCAWCAFDGDRIVGFIVLQLFPHPEPIHVEPDYRATGIAETLADKMLAFMREIHIRGFMVVADSDFAAKLCEDRGMERIQAPVYIMPRERLQ